MAAQPTSRYDSSIKVKQEVIDRIKKMGMDSAVKAANSGGESAEFVEGAKRMYGRDRVQAMNQANLKRDQNVAATNPLARRAPSVDNGPTSSGGGSKEEKKPTPMPASAPAAASRRTERSTGEKVLGAENARQVRKVTTPVSNLSADLAANREIQMEGAKKAVGNFYQKNIGHSLSNIFGGKKKRK